MSITFKSKTLQPQSPSLILPLTINILSHPPLLISLYNSLPFISYQHLPQCVRILSVKSFYLLSSPLFQEGRNHVCLIRHCKLQDLIVNKVWHIIGSVKTHWMRMNMQKTMSVYADLSLSHLLWHPLLITSPCTSPSKENCWAKTLEQGPYMLSAPVIFLSRVFLPLPTPSLYYKVPTSLGRKAEPSTNQQSEQNIFKRNQLWCSIVFIPRKGMRMQLNDSYYRGQWFSLSQNQHLVYTQPL